MKRLKDWKAGHVPIWGKLINQQASRCMDCGIPFCHQGCPLGNLIQNGMILYEKQLGIGIRPLHATNNFPEFTGTLCPSTLRRVMCFGNKRFSSIDKIYRARNNRSRIREGRIVPKPPKSESGKKVAIIGSGPTGLAGAQQLRRSEDTK